MYIIVGDQAANALKESHLILSLEKINQKGIGDRAYCVVPKEKITMFEIPEIDTWKNLHEQFVIEYEKGNFKYCQDAAEHLYGKFGGELDTFYDEILKRIS